MKALCVYCGSSIGANPAYVAAANALGAELAERHLTLIYGGGSVGLMGVVADSVIAGGGEVIGVMPQHLVEREIAHQALSELKVVADMHERKAVMSALADGFIALPGGFGTFEELFETLTWAQLGFHQKPTALLNVNGYFDDLLKFLDRAVDQGFLKAVHREMLLVESRPQIILEHLLHSPPLIESKWS